MKSLRRYTHLFVLALAIVITLGGIVAAPAGASPTIGATVDINHGAAAGTAVEKAGDRSRRLGTIALNAARAGLNNVPDDQVVCYVGANLPNWSPRPTVNWTVNLQCNGRWASGAMHLYLFYRFNQNDSWQLARQTGNIPLTGGDSSTRIMQGVPHTLGPCFPAYWLGQVYVEVTFHAGNPITDRGWFHTIQQPFLTC